MKENRLNFLKYVLFLCVFAWQGQMMGQTFNGASGLPIPLTGTGGDPCVGGPTESIATSTVSGPVGGSGGFSIDNVTLDITHTFDSDLEITLVSPMGTTLDLSSDNGGSGDNYTMTVFSDGFINIVSGTVPFTGTFEPEGGTLNGTFSGEDVNGDWTLSICDDAGFDTGTLNSWSITFVALECDLTCPGDIITSNDPRECGAFLNIPLPTASGASCGTIADPNSVVTSPTAMADIQFLGPAAGDDMTDSPITITGVPTMGFSATVSGTWNTDTDVAVNVVGEDGVTILGMAPVGTNCTPVEFGPLPISDADYMAWAADGQITISLVPTVLGVDNGQCGGNDVIEAFIEVATSSFPYVNDYNNTPNASDFYPVGTTTVCYQTTSGTMPIECCFDVTVTDDEGPIFDNCPDDPNFNLDPGECGVVFTYKPVVIDNCGGSGPAAVNPVIIDLGPPALGGTVANCNTAGTTELNNWFRTWTATGGDNQVFASVDVGFEETPDAAPITVNVYVNTGGPFPAGTLNLIGTGTAITTAMGAPHLFNVPIVPSGVFNNGDEVVIEIVIPAGFTNLWMGLGADIGTTWIVSAPCGATTPTDLATFGLTGEFKVQIEVGQSASAVVIQTDGPSTMMLPDTLNLGESITVDLDIGCYDFRFEATDADGLIDSCVFELCVNEFSNPRSELVCNPQGLQVSLDENCEAVIGADDILEGGPYGCYDTRYEVIIDRNGDGIFDPLEGNVLSDSDIGKSFTVLVRDLVTGNSCWSSIIVEDKLIPQLVCEDLEFACNTDLTPGTAVMDVTSEVITPGDSWASTGTFTNTITVSVSPNAVINDVNVLADITHTWVEDLAIQVESPAGTVVQVLNGGSCGDADNVDVRFDDEGSALVCGGAAAISGDVIPDNPLSAFDGELVAGDWVITVNDPIAGDGGIINELALEIEWNAEVTFPVSPLATVIPLGENSYTVEDLDNCFDALLEYVDHEVEMMCEDINSVITRVWTITDPVGNSSTCSQVISLTKVGTEALVLPPDWDGIDDGDAWGYQPVLECDAYCGSERELADNRICGPTNLYWTPLANGYPSPDASSNWSCGDVKCAGTGRPGGGCSNFNSTYWDHKIEICYGTYKIIRHWIVSDWCTGDVIEHNQVIEVKDSRAPWNTIVRDVYGDPVDSILVCPDPYTVGISGHDCDADIVELLPPVDVVDNCSHVYMTPTFPYGDDLFQDGFGRWFATNVPIGWYDILWTVDDGCGNIATCEGEVHVEDLTPPYAVCESYRQASLSTDGYVKINADAFDDGSNDNCGDVYFKVLRMDDENVDAFDHGSRIPINQAPGDFACDGLNGDDFVPQSGNRFYEVWFDDYVKFCCEDLDGDEINDDADNNTVRVIFRVYDVDPGSGPVTPGRHDAGGDLFGHYNDCMVQVQIVDKVPPVLICPPMMEVECDAHIDDSVLEDPNGPYGWVEVLDVCPGDVTVSINRFLDCDPNQSRRIVRTFIYSYFDGDGNPTSSSCSQTILLLDTDPFVIWDTRDRNYRPINNRFCTDAHGQPTDIAEVVPERCGGCTGPGGGHTTANDDVEWPCDLEIDCAQSNGDYSPDNLEATLSAQDALCARPEIVREGCGSIAVDYEDQLVRRVDSACLKIIRTWTIIDWCQFRIHRGSAPDGPCWTYFDDEESAYYYGYWTYVQVIKVNDQNDPIVPAMTENYDCLNTDADCGVWTELSIDPTDACSPIDEMSITYDIDANADGIYDIPGLGSSFAGYLPSGTHAIRWKVEDGCTNETKSIQTFIVPEECKAPTPVCEDALVIVAMPSSGMVEIWAVDYDASSFDNCDGPLSFTIERVNDQECDGTVIPAPAPAPSLKLDCNDLCGANEVTIPVRIHVTDEAGNTDFCLVSIILQDTPDSDSPEGGCPDDGPSPLQGTLTTEAGLALEGHPVEMIGEDADGNQGVTLRTAFTHAAGSYAFTSITGGQYIAPVKNDDIDNGLTTLDLIALQQHILGVDLLDTPYKMVAGDVDNNQNINVLDILQVQEVILGLRTEFTNNASWRYVSTDEQMSMSNPYTFEEPKDITGMSAEELSAVDFIGVKIGDVNGSARTNATANVVRPRTSLVLTVQPEMVSYGEEVRIPVTSANFVDVMGYQFTMTFDADELEFVRIESGVLTIKADNVATQRASVGMVMTNWYDVKSHSFASTDVLFTIVMRGSDITSLEATSDVTAAEAYQGGSINGLSLIVAGQSVESFVLHQNEPNPFQAYTVVRFDLPIDSKATLTVHDVTGKVLYADVIDATAGDNYIELTKSELGGAQGVMYYTVETDEYNATKKMIVIE